MLKSKSLAILVGAAILGAVVVVTAPPASADIITSSLTVSDGTLGAGPFGSVQINLTDSTHATLTFTAASGFTFGDHNAIDANINATSFTVSGATANCASCTLMASIGASNIDGDGSFNLTSTVGNFGPNSDFTTGSFTVTDLSGTWASALQVLAFNSGGGNCPLGCDAAAHARNQTSGNTAYVGETVVPAPVIGHGLFVLLAVSGVLFGGKLLETLKKHRLDAA
jgi:hypothetical protein